MNDKPPSRERDWLVIAATLLLLVPVLLPALVTYLPEIYLQDDPRMDPRMMRRVVTPTEFGPAGLAWWNVYTVAAAAIAVLVAAMRGVRLSKAGIGLAAVTAAACAWHMHGPMSDRLQGGAWISAAALGIAAFHLGQQPTARRWAVAAMVAILIPIVLEAVFDRFISLPLTVKTYFENREQVLASRGWEIGSPEALKYEQRLMAPDVTGSYGMSNVLAAVAAALTLMALALAVNARAWLARLPLIAMSLAGLWVVYATRSKAGLGLLTLGLVMLVVCQLVTKRRKGQWLVASLGVGLTALVLGAVIVRGLMGPPPPEVGPHDPSLSVLFRYHYWQGAACAVMESTPMSLLTGLGPSAFREAYHHCRNPISPEIIQSTHSAFVDGAAMLGVGGWCMVVLLLGWVAVAPRSLVLPVEESAKPASGYKPDVVAAGLLAAALFGVQYVKRFPEMAYDSALLWLAGMLGFVGTAAGLVRLGRSEAGERGVRVGLVAAAAVILAHGQFDLVFFHLTGCGFAWFVIGLAAAGGVAAREETHGLKSVGLGRRSIVPAVMLIVAVIMGVMYAGPITQQQAFVARADGLLRVNRVPEALAELDASGATIADDRLPLRWRVRLNLETAIGLAQHGRQREAKAAVDRTMAVIEQAVAQGLDARTAGLMRSQTQEIVATYLGDTDAWARVADELDVVVAVDPYSVQPHRDAAEVSLKAGRGDRALELYRETLVLSERMYLDPTQQLSASDRERVEERVRELEAAR